MKKILVSILCLLAVAAQAQVRPYTILSDTFLITSNSGNGGTLQIKNNTKNVKGFLYNTGNGVTIFKRGAVVLDANTIVIGDDTIHLSSGSAQTLQQVITNGARLTSNNIISAAQNNLTIDSLKTFNAIARDTTNGIQHKLTLQSSNYQLIGQRSGRIAGVQGTYNNIQLAVVNPFRNNTLTIDSSGYLFTSNSSNNTRIRFNGLPTLSTTPSTILVADGDTLKKYAYTPTVTTPAIDSLRLQSGFIEGNKSGSWIAQVDLKPLINDSVKALRDSLIAHNSRIGANTTAIATKQDQLVSGTNIKTINGTSVLGAGNISISGADSATFQTKFRSDTGRVLTYTEIAKKRNLSDTTGNTGAANLWVVNKARDSVQANIDRLKLSPFRDYDIAVTPNKYAWYSTRYRSSFTTNSSAWNDLSGNSRALTGTGTPVLRATGYGVGTFNTPNAWPYYEFSSGKSFSLSSLTLSQPFAVYVVLKNDGYTDATNMITLGGSTFIRQRNIAGTGVSGASDYRNISFYAGGSNYALNYVVRQYFTDWTLHVFYFNGATSRYCINDEPAHTPYPTGNVENPGTAGLSQITIGGASFSCAEVLILSGIPDDQTDRMIRGKLMYDFGIKRKKFAIHFGDSQTRGAASSNGANNFAQEYLDGWAGKADSILQLDQINIGWDGRTVYDVSVAYADSNALLSKLPKYLRYDDAIFTFAYGVNDATAYASDISSGVWKTAYKAIIQKALDAGIPKKNIVICTVPYRSNNPTASTIALCNTATREIAAELGVKLSDNKQVQLDNGGDTLMYDASHMNSTGNRIVGVNVANVISQ